MLLKDVSGRVDYGIITIREDEFTAVFERLPERLTVKRVFDGNVDGTQLHMLSYLGRTWGKGEPRFSSEQLITWTSSSPQ